MIKQQVPSLEEADLDDALDMPSDADRHAARKLQIHPAQVRLVSRALWGRTFAEERDARIGDASELAPRSLQARRGLVTRPMIAEVRTFLGKISEQDAD